MDIFADLLQSLHVDRNRAVGRPTMAWHIDCTTGRAVARWVILPADGSADDARHRQDSPVAATVAA